jgi:hypothetical protein
VLLLEQLHKMGYVYTMASTGENLRQCQKNQMGCDERSLGKEGAEDETAKASKGMDADRKSNDPYSIHQIGLIMFPRLFHFSCQGIPEAADPYYPQLRSQGCNYHE